MQISTAPASEWQPLPCPRGATVLLLTRWGRPVVGQWYAEGGFIGWFPIPEVTDEIRELMTT
jgi:hypothetical protein